MRDDKTDRNKEKEEAVGILKDWKIEGKEQWYNFAANVTLSRNAHDLVSLCWKPLSDPSWINHFILTPKYDTQKGKNDDYQEIHIKA